MEKQLFDWKGCDAVDEGLFVFYDCTLKIDFGRYFPAGTKVSAINFDMEKSKVELLSDEGVILSRGLRLTLAD